MCMYVYVYVYVHVCVFVLYMEAYTYRHRHRHRHMYVCMYVPYGIHVLEETLTSYSYSWEKLWQSLCAQRGDCNAIYWP